MSSRYRDSGNPDCKIYVGDLGSSASKQDLEDAFSYYGPIRNVWVARNPPGFAFVEFEDPRDAEDAVRGLDGRFRVIQKKYRPRKMGDPVPPSGGAHGINNQSEPQPGPSGAQNKTAQDNPATLIDGQFVDNTPRLGTEEALKSLSPTQPIKPTTDNSSSCSDYLDQLFDRFKRFCPDFDDDFKDRSKQNSSIGFCCEVLFGCGPEYSKYKKDLPGIRIEKKWCFRNKRIWVSALKSDDLPPYGETLELSLNQASLIALETLSKASKIIIQKPKCEDTKILLTPSACKAFSWQPPIMEDMARRLNVANLWDMVSMVNRSCQTGGEYFAPGQSMTEIALAAAYVVNRDETTKKDEMNKIFKRYIEHGHEFCNVKYEIVRSFAFQMPPADIEESELFKSAQRRRWIRHLAGNDGNDDGLKRIVTDMANVSVSGPGPQITESTPP